MAWQPDVYKRQTSVRVCDFELYSFKRRFLVVAREFLDNTPQTAQIKAGQTVTLEFRNQPTGQLIIHKLSGDEDVYKRQ